MTTIQAVIKRRTDKAILIVVTEGLGGREEWIPLSQCNHLSHSDTGLSTIELEDWLVDKKDLHELVVD